MRVLKNKKNPVKSKVLLQKFIWEVNNNNNNKIRGTKIINNY